MTLVARSVQQLAYPTALAAVTATQTPCLTREYDGVVVDVYLAKASHAAWTSHALYCLVEHARSSYRAAYGPQVVLFDEHDDKAWIYVAVAAYERKGRVFEEVLTLRFVPASGLPLRNDDLDFYVHRNEPDCDLLDLVGRREHRTDVTMMLRGCYSQSRMGAVRPTARDGSALAGNRHIGLAWSLMLDCFLNQMEETRQRCQWLTSQTTEQLRVLGARIPTRPFDEQFGLGSGSVILNRKDPRVRALCYAVPTYFLNLRDISRLLSRLLDEGAMTVESIEAAVTPGVSVQRALSQPQPALLKRLHVLFAGCENVAGSSLSSEDLRRLADLEVRDGPVLRVTQLDGLQRELEALRLAAHPARHASFIRPVQAMNETA